MKPIAAVLAIAQEGQRRGLPMAVASGGGHKHVREGLRVNGLEGMFKAIVCAEVIDTAINGVEDVFRIMIWCRVKYHWIRGHVQGHSVCRFDTNCF